MTCGFVLTFILDGGMSTMKEWGKVLQLPCLLRFSFWGRSSLPSRPPFHPHSSYCTLWILASFWLGLPGWAIYLMRGLHPQLQLLGPRLKLMLLYFSWIPFYLCNVGLQICEILIGPTMGANCSYRTKLYSKNLLSGSRTRLLTSLSLLQWISEDGIGVPTKDTPMLKLALVMLGIQRIF